MRCFPTPLLIVLFAAVALVGCDTDDLDDRGFDDNGVRSVTFTLNDSDFDFDFDLRTDGLEAQYESRRFPELSPNVVDEGVVLLYAADVVDQDGLRRRGWTALPLTLGFDDDNDFFVDYTIATTYTFDIDRLYVNLVASNDFGEDQFALTDAVLDNVERVDFRLVTIPGGGFARGIDYSDYEAVKQAYNLPD